METQTIWHCSRCATRRHISPIPFYYLSRLRTSNVYRFNERKRLYAGKGKKQKIELRTLMTALLANSPAQAESLLHTQERATVGIGFHVNADKTECMCFNQRGDIPTLKGGPLKLVDKFIYLGSSVSSTENYINMRLGKAWTAIDRLSVIWTPDQTDKIKRIFFQASVVSILLYRYTTWRLTKRMEKKLDGNYTRILRTVLNKSWKQHHKKQQLYGHLPLILKTIQIRRTRKRDTAGEVKMNS